MNYTRYVLDIGHAGDALDLRAGLLPCVAGYAKSACGCCTIPPPRWRQSLRLTDHNYGERAIWPACVPPSSCSRRRPPARRTEPLHRAGADFHHRHPVGIGILADGAERLMTSPLLPPGIGCGISPAFRSANRLRPAELRHRQRQLSFCSAPAAQPNQPAKIIAGTNGLPRAR